MAWTDFNAGDWASDWYDDPSAETFDGNSLSATMDWGPPTNEGKDQGLVNKALGAMGRLGLNPALEVRGGLRFNYAPTNTHNRTRIRWVPFYENPHIVESRRARYAKQNVFLRNEPVRLFTGADARKFKIDIHYSLVHLAQMMSTKKLFSLFSYEPMDKIASDQELEDMKRYVLSVVLEDTQSTEDEAYKHMTEAINNPPPQAAPSDYPAGLGLGAGEAGRQLNVEPGDSTGASTPFNVGLSPRQMEVALGITNPDVGLKHRENPIDGPNQEAPWGLPASVDSVWNTMVLYVMNSQKNWTSLTTLLHYAITHIRNSVIGTATSPVKGPPIIELKWGAMYDFTPCIVTDYRIEPIEEAGYDVKSLLSQRLKFSLTLEEMRNIHGNLWGNPAVTGNLPGWDTVLDMGGRIDPDPNEKLGMGEARDRFKA